MKPLSERDENQAIEDTMDQFQYFMVGMKPLSERDENLGYNGEYKKKRAHGRNEATL